MSQTFDSIKAAQAQREYCKENKAPLFAPEYGSCFRCKKDIYKAISVEEASKSLITGCPHCHYSFVD